MKNKLLLIISLFLFFSCKEKEPLFKEIDRIENSWSKKELDEFKVLPEEGYSNKKLKFGNKYKSHKLDSSLIKYFNSKEVFNENTIKGAVLIALHRKLNEKPMNISVMISELAERDKEYNELIVKTRKRVKMYYTKYNINDTLIVRMPIENNTALLYSNPNSETLVYNDENDLLVKGVVVNKRNDDFLGKQFKLKIVSMNKSDIKILEEDVKVQDEFIINLEDNIIEDVKNNDMKLN